ncbi:Protein of uncharacterised function (DUF3396) [Neisseria zoodegmatis]|uniref:Protein of uncharacterized function (DUF3396) n=1 Tax=Neisseria zoodegmatis TaxID=326523 RepID=A0A378WHI8_9NEIS|nr:DUF3396 domain-containing protein [Neisseria zoodegmatis]SUA36789.1 Protein of uncharacterised function (DUF3396) [Neisseria zoodegmatis]
MLSKQYEALEQEYRDILLHDEEHKILAQLGLVILIYFHDGGSVAGQRKVLEVFDRFYMHYHPYLKSHFWDGMRRFAKLNQTAFVKKQQKMIAEAEQGEALFGYLSSDEWGEYSPDYAIGALTSAPSDDQNKELSFLHLNFPLTVLRTVQGIQEFEEWIAYLCKQFSIFHGYAGLTLALPYSGHEYQFYEHSTTKRYWGITPDFRVFAKNWKTGLKSVNWYTFVGKKLQGRLNKQEVDNVLNHYPDITLQTCNDTMIFKAGNFPSTGDRNKPLPVPYLVVNNLLRPARVEKLKDAMHSAYGNGKTRYSASQGYYWLRRWDNANFEQGIFNPEGDKAELMPVYRQKPYEVPFSGMWVPDNLSEGIEQHFEKGEIFPMEGEHIWVLPNRERHRTKDDAVWRLVKRDDGGPVEMPSEF